MIPACFFQNFEGNYIVFHELEGVVNNREWIIFEFNQY